MNAATRARTATNGAARSRVGSLAAAGGMPYDDPMSKVLGLDAKTSSLAAWLGFGSGGTLLFVGLTALVLVVAWWHTVQLHRATSKIEEIEILREETPPPPPPTAEPKQEAPAARAVSHEPPPPPPAQAAKVMTQEPKPDEPVDLTGNTFVQGNADTYAGGFTTATGTGTAAARTAPGASSTPGGNGPPTGAPPPPPPGPDRSRTASLGGGSEWSCPFPQEADTAQIDEAYVTLQVDVKADGSPAAVKVLGDPGNGFGREARRCALGKRYSTALDHDGTAIPGATKPFRVHFSR
jgi:periplasmic protein TonB